MPIAVAPKRSRPAFSLNQRLRGISSSVSMPAICAATLQPRIVGAGSSSVLTLSARPGNTPETTSAIGKIALRNFSFAAAVVRTCATLGGAGVILSPRMADEPQSQGRYSVVGLMVVIIGSSPVKLLSCEATQFGNSPPGSALVESAGTSIFTM